MTKKAKPAPVPVTDEALAKARATIAAHHEKQLAAKVADAQQYVGKFYRVQYKHGPKRWWVYCAITGVDEGGVPLGWSFQQTPEGHVEVSSERTIYVWGDDHRPITPAAFWSAAGKVHAVVVLRLSREYSR